MRIYTRAGDLAFKTFTFPDGQPHFKLETYEDEFRSVTVEMAIRNPTELLQAVLVNQVLRQQGYSEVNLDIRYLLGARMDRAIGPDEPFTLECVARMINGCGFSRVRILDAHSEVATRLIRNSINVLPYQAVSAAALGSVNYYKEPARWVIPDKGAESRVMDFWKHVSHATEKIIRASKKRNPSTGALSGFSVDDGKSFLTSGEAACLIIDDICDGGGTFVGLAKELRKAGAKRVNLFVTHGIFSKGPWLEGIDRIFTTDSYYVPNPTDVYGHKNLVPYPVTVIPISMKELKV